MSIEKEKILCRCCHSEGDSKSFNKPCFNPFDGEETYIQVLREHLNIELQPMESMIHDITCTICDICTRRLQDVTEFRRQVLECEVQFQNILEKLSMSILDSKIVVKVEKVSMENYNDIRNEDDSDHKYSDPEDDKTDVQIEIKEHNKIKTRVKTKKKRKEDKQNKEVVIEEICDAPVKKKCKRGPKFRLKEEDFTTDGTDFICKKCEKRYDKLCSLRFHLKNKHYKIPRFSCEVCSKEFMTPAPWTKHKLEAHNIDDRYKCNACKGTFNTKVQLRKHINNFHMMGAKYKCEFCDYESFSFEGLYKHKFKHKTVKDFHCRFCRKSFLRKTTLDLHERIHTGDRRKVCKVCGQAFVQKASLNYHMAKYHPEVNF